MSKLFTPIDGVIIQIEKKTNTAGIEVSGGNEVKNEGIIISNSSYLTEKVREMFKDHNGNIILNLLKKGKKVKFTEGYTLEDNKFFVELKNIIGIFEN